MSDPSPRFGRIPDGIQRSGLSRSKLYGLAAQNPGLSDLQARIEAYELAARMQLSAPKIMDLAAESAATARFGSSWSSWA